MPQEENEPPLSATLFSWLKPFDDDVWVVIVVMFIVSASVFWFLEHDQVGGDIEGQDIFSQIAVAVYLTVTTFTGGGGVMLVPKSIAGRLFAFSWSLWCLLTVTAYTASLASFLVVSSVSVQGFSSIEDAIRDRALICIWGNAADYEIVSSIYPEARLVKSSSHRGVLQDLAAGKCSGGVVTTQSWEVMQLLQEYNGNCSLSYVGRPIYQIQAGFVVLQEAYYPKCTSLIRDVLDIHFREMKRDQFIDKAWAKHYERLLDQSSSVACSNTGSRRSRLKGGGGGGSGAAAASGAIGQNAVAKRLSMRDLGGTHITYLGLISLSMCCWLAGTNTKEGRKFLVPWLTRRWSRKAAAAEQSGVGVEAGRAPVRHRGLLYKQGKFGGQGRWRFFVLDDQTLRYYKDEASFLRNEDCRGEFWCFGLIARSEAGFGPGALADHGLVIEGALGAHDLGDVAHRKMLCACRSAVERDAWVAQIDLAAKGAVNRRARQDSKGLIPRLARSSHAMAAHALTVEDKIDICTSEFEACSKHVNALSADVTCLKGDVARLLQLVEALACTEERAGESGPASGQGRLQQQHTLTSPQEPAASVPAGATLAKVSTPCNRQVIVARPSMPPTSARDCDHLISAQGINVSASPGPARAFRSSDHTDVEMEASSQVGIFSIEVGSA